MYAKRHFGDIYNGTYVLFMQSVKFYSSLPYDKNSKLLI